MYSNLGEIMTKNECNLSDCDYNALKQLVKMNQLLWSIDTFIKDAKKAKRPETVKAFEIIKKDTIKHAELLKKIVTGKKK